MNRRADGRLKISVIVPSWRDADYLARLLPAVASCDQAHETIVVEASDDPRSETTAREFGAQILRCPMPNRGAQLNLGAAAATGDVLLFQHADTELTRAHLAAIESALLDSEIIGGAFHRKFDNRHPRLIWLEDIARVLARHGRTFYGDQSIFVRRDFFRKLGGFAEIPLMEDLEFSRRLRATGKTVVLDPPLRSSARRHLRRGALRTSLQNGLFIALYKAGVSPQRLHHWYYPPVPETSSSLEQKGFASQ